MQRAKYYTCKRLRLLEYLLNLGFNPVKTIPDAINPRYNWWLFTNTPELEGAITAYFSEIKGGN